MNKLTGLRIAFTLVIAGLMVFSLATNLRTNAQDKDTCKDLGWTAVDASEVDLSGEWTGHQNRNCRESAAWQYNFSVTITKNDSTGVYEGTVSDGTPMTVNVKGNRIVFVRDLTKGAGKDPETGVVLQIWRGKIERNDDRRIRIYGTWSGAFERKKTPENNLDFMMLKFFYKQ